MLNDQQIGCILVDYYTCDGEAGGRGGSVQQNRSNYKAIKYVKSTYLLSEWAKNCPIWPPLKVYVILVILSYGQRALHGYNKRKDGRYIVNCDFVNFLIKTKRSKI